MKKILYKNPVMAAIIINLFTLFLLIYSINERISFLFMIPFFTGVLNRNIMDNGEYITNKNKIIIVSSFLLILAIYLIYGFNIIRLRNS
ncbi:hypothetical protein [Clostridium sp.]|uniref:hypothetical protein n=1 Tax=Clostridium sp. TaxID=1506 RepID=UPI0025C225EC|nr:hypothetical protein [Clostridium sp.]